MEEKKTGVVTIFNTDLAEILHRPTEPVDFNVLNLKQIQEIVRTMAKIMKQADGVGLAANQINVKWRIAMISHQAWEKEQKNNLVMVNPMITNYSNEKCEVEEGCLSVPKVYGLVNRAATITVRYLTEAGVQRQIIAEGLAARVIQHEVDHLDGILFLDRTKNISKGAELI